MGYRGVMADYAEFNATTWHIALCIDCTLPILPQPFRDEAERDAWAEAHEQTGHRVAKGIDPGGYSRPTSKAPPVPEDGGELCGKATTVRDPT